MEINKSGMIAVIVICCVILVWVALHISLHASALGKPYAVAHRGGAGLAPENTLSAISKSINIGIKKVEVDIQRTSDGVLVLLHDRTIKRTTGDNGYVSELNWEEVSQLDAGSYYSEGFAGESIPALSNILEVITNNDITLFLEVKNPFDYPDIGKQIVDSLHEYNAQNNVVIISFDHEWLKTFQDAAPEIKSGLLCYWKGSMPSNSNTTYLGVQWAAVIIDPTLIARAHNAGLDVFVWSVNSRLCMKIMQWLGVDGIVTDKPDVLLEVINQD